LRKFLGMGSEETYAGMNQLLWSENLCPFTLERYHKVVGHLRIDPGICEKLVAVRVLQTTKDRGDLPVKG
jgi:hypothetical protein